MRRLWGLSLAGLLLFVSGAGAGPVNLINDFGSEALKINGKIATIPKTAKVLPGCETMPEGLADCSFEMPKGVVYFVFNNEIRGARYRFDGQHQEPVLGLRAGDSDAVIRRLSKHYGSDFQKDMIGNAAIYSTPFVEARVCQARCRLSITFAPSLTVERKMQIISIFLQPE